MSKMKAGQTIRTSIHNAEVGQIYGKYPRHSFALHARFVDLDWASH